MIDQFVREYRWLSNFWPSKVQLDGQSYRTVEHAYQAAKTADSQQRRQIQSAFTPNEAKRLGRLVTLRPDWETVKLTVMEDLLRQKFADPELNAKLLATGSEELVEGNYWGDRYWGVCNGCGENHLGKLLMKLRAA